jgi:hypothetical protein
MTTTLRSLKTTLTVALLAILGTVNLASLSTSALAAADQHVEPTAQMPKKTMLVQRDTRSTPVQTSNDKKVKSSGGLMGPIGAIIDGESGGGMPLSSVSISTLGSISPAGLSMTVTPDTALPLSAWKNVKCNVTTKYFTTISGQQPNDDVIQTTPTLSFNNNSISFVCPYKTAAHALNIAKSVAMATSISIAHSKNGMDYAYSGTLLYSCARATKATVLMTCS